ncbi:MAG: efflux RND transporter periplasmic adaptor subunit [Bacteroidales bacterium]|nr:efflux RND transporter periplasmic adaptor subunit [Bacteroidales bacterium]
MKTLKIQIPLIAILLASVVSSCTKTEANNKESQVIADQQKKVPVKVMKISKKIIDRKIDYTANLKAFEEVHYAPAAQGHIKSISVEVGSRVSKGDLLAMMDNTQLETALLQLENAESNYRRLDTLYHLNSISEQQYESAKNGYELAKANVNFMSENTKLTSPINGIITAKYFEGGELFSGVPNTEVGKAAIVTIMQINPLKAVIDISEKYYPVVKKGMKADITSDIYKKRVFAAEVFRVSPIINSNSRTFEVELVVENKNEILRPGMFSRVSLSIDKVEAIVVPAITILKQNGTNNRYIYVVDKNGEARKIDIEIVNRFNENVEIYSNELNEGDLVVVAGQEKLANGIEVEISK